MRRIENKFQELRKKGEGALIGYITAGSPTPDLTKEASLALIKGGVDVLELGIPFSDPIADGPTIQRSSQLALEQSTTPRMVLELAKELRQKIDNPLVLLSYYNPIYKAGLQDFMKLAKESQIDGLIIPDLPIEEAGDYCKFARNLDIDTIFLASPTTSESRLHKILEKTSGFLYLVSLFGVTGARKNLQEYTINLVRRFRALTKGRINMAVGFGISKPEHVRTIIGCGADGAIVGSGFVEILNGEDLSRDEILKNLEEYSASLKVATIRQ